MLGSLLKTNPISSDLFMGGRPQLVHDRGSLIWSHIFCLYLLTTLWILVALLSMGESENSQNPIKLTGSAVFGPVPAPFPWTLPSPYPSHVSPFLSCPSPLTVMSAWQLDGDHSSRVCMACKSQGEGYVVTLWIHKELQKRIEFIMLWCLVVGLLEPSFCLKKIAVFQ